MVCGLGGRTFALCAALSFGLSVQAFAAPRQMENLSRGLVSANVGKGMLVSWRLLGTDAPNTEFNLYRDGTKIATIDGKGATNYLDASGSAASKYSVAAVVGGKEGEKSGLSFVFDKTASSDGKSFPYKTLKLDRPGNLKMPDGSTCSYTPNDMSTADLDGDGELELVLKWDPSNQKDNSQGGYTGNVYIDAYKMDGKRMWRIDLGHNIRAGAHYTQFMVYDLDGDGIAEVAMKTSDGTVDGTGKVIGDKSKDYRVKKDANGQRTGTIMSGNEFLTVFSGKNGAEITTINYEPGRGITKNWGDNYGNRSERMLAAIAYLDGVHPSLIMVRGYYTNAYVVAYDFDGKKLKQRWYHKSEKSRQGLNGQGNHNISVGDINGDGKDEIVFGAAALKSDGTVLYSTGLGHGDAMHLSDLDPDREGLELWDVHEEGNAKYGDELRAPDGKIIWGTPGNGKDNGRGLAADIDADNRGFEMWSSISDGVKNVKGKKISGSKPSVNFRIYFDGDLQDELFDGAIDKWDTKGKKANRYFTYGNVNKSTTNNGTKKNPCLVADLFGDWREELVLRSGGDASMVTIFGTPVKTDYRVYTLMHDPHYRVSIAWQNVAYNQPPHLGYYLPDAVKNLKQPSIYLAGSGATPVIPDTDPVVDPVTPVNPPASETTHDMTKESFVDASAPIDGAGAFEDTNEGWKEKGYYNFDNTAESFGTWKVYASDSATTTISVVFANGGDGSRDMNLSVNGGDATLVAMPSTGSWTTWSEVKVPVKLVKGENTIKLTSTSADGGANVDGFYFGVPGVSLTAGGTDVPPMKLIAGPVSVHKAGFAEVDIYNMSGRMVGSIAKSVAEGETIVDLSNEPISKGTYLVRVKIDGKLAFKGIYKK